MMLIVYDQFVLMKSILPGSHSYQNELHLGKTYIEELTLTCSNRISCHWFSGSICKIILALGIFIMQRQQIVPTEKGHKVPQKTFLSSISAIKLLSILSQLINTLLAQAF